MLEKSCAPRESTQKPDSVQGSATGKTVTRESAVPGKQPKLVMYFILILAAILIAILLFMVSLHSSIQKNNDLIQEQINYIYKKDNMLEGSFNKIISDQKGLLEKFSEKEFSDIQENITKEPSELVPFDHIKKDQIMVTENKVIIRNENVNWAQYTDTGSMEPVLSSTANGIEIKPVGTDEVHVGDIISYFYNDKIIVHRVIRIGIDKDGWYAVTKADTSEREDPLKVRFSQVNGILVGIIY